MLKRAGPAGVTMLILAAATYVSATSSITPPCVIDQVDPSKWDFTITKDPTVPDVPWSDIVVQLIDREGTNINQAWSWSLPTPSGLGTGAPVSVSYVSAGGYPSLFCNVTDLAGNNYINNGDSFTIEPDGTGFDSASVDELAIIYKPTMGAMWTGELRDGKLVTPSGFPWLLPVLVVAGCVAVVALLLLRRRKGGPALASVPKL